MKEEMLSQIEQAIDTLARESLGPAAMEEAGAAAGGAPRPAADTAAQVAAIWQMIAELDPEIARRIPGYDDAGNQPAGE
jgi:hypothetical protein